MLTTSVVPSRAYKMPVSRQAYNPNCNRAEGRGKRDEAVSLDGAERLDGSLRRSDSTAHKASAVRGRGRSKRRRGYGPSNRFESVILPLQ